MNGPASDQALLEIVTAASLADSTDVIKVMQAMDQALASDDGLKWFNLLYLMVTKQVRDHPPVKGWEDERWIARLDVIFAGLYLTEVAKFLGGQPTVPTSWMALFEARHSAVIDRIQFALAGMNAHINHDLSLALVQTDQELQLTPGVPSPEHDDFEHVNGLLESVLPQALQFLATGILGQLAQDTGKIGRLLAIWNVRAARDLAWDFADHLRTLSSPSRDIALTVQDKLTGALGRSLLLSLG